MYKWHRVNYCYQSYRAVWTTVFKVEFPQFSTQCRIFSPAVEFASFHRICMFSRNFAEFWLVIRGQIWHILVWLRQWW